MWHVQTIWVNSSTIATRWFADRDAAIAYSRTIDGTGGRLCCLISPTGREADVDGKEYATLWDAWKRQHNAPNAPDYTRLRSRQGE